MNPSNPNVTLGVFNELTEWVLPQAFVERIKQVPGLGQLRVAQTRSQLLRALPDTHVLLGWPISEEEFRRFGQSLLWIQLIGSSADIPLAMKGLRDSTIRITTAAGTQKYQAAEHVFMLMLSLARRFRAAMETQSSRKWSDASIAEGVLELHGRRLGIVGAGAVGLEVARLGHAFGMTVWGSKAHPGQVPEALDRLMGPAELETLLGWADIVVVCVPPTPATRNLISQRQFRAMKPHAHLINISRGGVIDENALADALTRNQIGAAAMDGFETEPLPAHSKLWTLPNCLITPHMAGLSPRHWDRITTLFCDNLHQFMADKPMLNLVDRKRGY